MKTKILPNQIFRNCSRLQRSCWSATFLLTFLLVATSSWGQIAQRGTDTTNNSTNASVTSVKLAGVAAGVTKPTKNVLN